MFVSTARENLLAHAEEWDPDLGVAQPRRPQDEFRGPLMSEDELSVFKTGVVRDLASRSAG